MHSWPATATFCAWMSASSNWATVIGFGAYVLGDSFHRPTGPLGIALAVLVLCLFVTCIAILLRNLKRLEDQAVRMLPDPLALDVGKKKQHAPQDS
jgi:hypothetical protein